MLVRNAILLVSLFAMAIAIVVDFVVPALSGIIFYALLLWLIASFFIYRMPAVSRNLGRGPTRPSPTPVAAPPAFGPGASPPVELEFCMYCGTHVDPGTNLCPACGHALHPV